MATGMLLSSVLAASELEALPQEVENKLEAFLNDRQEQVRDLKEKHERLRVDSEQKYFEIEKQLIASNGKLESETRACLELRKQIADIEQKYGESSHKVHELQEKLFESEKSKDEFERKCAQFEADNKDLTLLLERRDQEVMRLNDEWKAISDKAVEANTAKCEALAKLEESESRNVSREMREKRLNQEKEQMEHQLDWLNKELREKSTEMLNFRKEQSGHILDLEAQLENKTDELNRMEQVVEALKTSNEEQAGKIENYIQKLKDARDNQTQMEEQYRTEIVAQEKLVALYKSSASDCDSKVNQLTSAVEELQKLLREATEANGELQKARCEEEAAHEEKIKQREEKISQQEKELKHANELLEATKKGPTSVSDENLEAMFPSAAATSRLLSSGMTLTQIYSEYVTVSETLHLEKQENKRLNLYLDQIIQEIEEKAPIMRKQREDYEKSVQAIDELTRKLDNAMLECEKLRVNFDDTTRRNFQLARENQRFKQQTVDLGQQVRMLLKELEEAHGAHVTTAMDEANLSSSEVSSSSQIISQKLVSFRNIEELQAQNQKLIGVVRDLSEKKEEEEKQAVDAKTLELKTELENAVREIEEMKSTRERQAQMVESIVRQRDMYRVLLSQNTTDPVPGLLSPVTSTPVPSGTRQPVTQPPQSPGVDKKRLEEAQAALKEMQAEFTTYRRERAENEKLLSEQQESLRKQVSELRVNNAKLASQLDFAGERYKILQGNADGYKKEIAALQEKIKKMTASIIKHEQTINILRQDAKASQENLSRTEVQLESMRAERDLLKTSEARLQQEKESLFREQRSHNVLVNNLKAIQNNQEKADFETRVKLGHQIEILEKERDTLKRKLDSVDNQHRAVVMTLQRQLNDVKNQQEKERSMQKQHKEEALQARQQMGSLKQQLSQVEAQLAAAELRLANVAEIQKDGMQQEIEGLHGEIKTLKTELNQAQAETRALRSQLEQARGQIEKYKSMANSMEQSMREQNEASRKVQEEVEKKLQQAKEEVAQKERQIATMESEKQDILKENKRVTEESHALNADLRKEVASMQRELEQAIAQREMAQTTEAVARDDCIVQTKLAQETQEKYERELVLHAADVESLTAVKQELEGFNARLSEAQEESKRATEALNSKEAWWAEHEKATKEEMSKLEERIKDLQGQNSILHGELETVTDQMVCLQQAQEVTLQEALTSGAVPSTSVQASDKSSEQLLQVMKFLRKEKEIAEAHLERVEVEKTRLSQKAEMLEQQLADANKSIGDERARTQESLQTAAQHADLMRKVENLNVLTDSNKLLREERDQLILKTTELEKKVTELQEKLGPVQESNKELSGLRDVLQAEKTALESEVSRWKARTNHLIEQCNKADPEEHRRLVQEKEAMGKQLATVREECNNLSQECEELKVQVARKDADAEEKLKNIIQLKKIGRKYRMQAEEVQKELDTLKAKKEQEGSQQQASAAQEERIKVLELENSRLEQEKNRLEQERSKLEQEKSKLEEEKGKVEQEKGKVEQEKTKAEQEKSQLEKEKGKLEQEKVQLEQHNNSISEQLGSAEYERNTVTKKLKELETALKEKDQKMQSLAQEVQKLRDSEIKLREEKDEVEKKKEQFRQMVQTAKTRLTERKEQIEKVTSELQQAKQRAVSLEKIKEELETRKSLLEKRIAELEKELNQSRAALTSSQDALERSHRDMADMSSKLTHMHRETPQQGVRPTMSASERTSVSTSETPRTASIRPMSTPAAQSRQAAPVQPVRSSSAEAKALASIRPMPMSGPTPSTSQTPTATVMPTTLSVHEEEATPTPSGQVPPSSQQLRPTQPVQPVSPHVEAEGAPPVEEVEPQWEQQPVVEVTPTQAAEPMPSTTTAGPPDAASHPPKRTREDLETSRDEVSTDSETPQVKRTRTQDSVETATVAPEPGPSSIVDAGPSGVPEEKQVGEAAESQQETEVIAEIQPDNTQEAQEDLTLPPAAAKVTTEPSQPVARQKPLSRQASLSKQQQQVEPNQVAVEALATVEQVAPLEPQKQQPQAEVQISEAQPVRKQEVVTPQMAPQTQSLDDDIIIVADDEEDHEEEEEEYTEEEEGMEDFEEEEEPEEDEEYDDNELQADTYEFQGEDGEDMDEDGYEAEEAMQEGEEEGEEDDDDIVIVEDDNDHDDASMEAQESNQQQTQQPVAPQMVHLAPDTQRQVPPLARVPGRTERLPSLGRSQLQPFTLGTQGGAFEEGDECIVPSTPTLFVPRRNDGFAEAVSSPQVPSGRFVFGSGAEGLSQPELAQLASQGALGMDDTRMDLSQLEEGAGTGRSVPTTPLPITPPTITVTEAPPADSDVQEVTEVSEVSTDVSSQAGQQTSAESVQSGGEVGQQDSSGGDIIEVGQGGGDDVTDTSATQQVEPSRQTTEENKGEGGVAEAGQSTDAEAPSGGSERGADARLDDKPGTSQERSEGQSAAKPKIQRIVWNESGGSGVPQQTSQVTPVHRSFQQQQQGPMRGRAQTAFRSMRRQGTSRGIQHQQQMRGISRGRAMRGSRGTQHRPHNF